MVMRQEGPASVGKLAVVLVGIAVAIVGCHKVTGGGWLAGVNGGKATFAFQAQCVKGEPVEGFSGTFLDQFEGQFQYNDRGAGVRFHGDINANNSFIGVPEGWNCSDVVELLYPAQLNQALIAGECTSPGGVKGTFSVEVTDNGTPGSVAGDIITVSTPSILDFGDWETGAPPQPCTDSGLAYSNSGLLGGGNIVSHGHKDASQGAKKTG